MIRNPELRTKKIKQRFIKYVWTYCEACGNEFKHVIMWRYKGEYRRHYLCENCCPDYEDVLAFLRIDPINNYLKYKNKQ